MKSDNMRGVVTFTIFSFLLLTIATFFVLYRNDLYNADTGPFIRIGFILGDRRNGTEKEKDVKLRMQTVLKENVLDTPISHSKNTQDDSIHEEGSKQRLATPFYDKILAILATRSHHPVETDVQKSFSGVEITTENPLNYDPIRRMISKSRDIVPTTERKADSPILTIETIPVRTTSMDREAINAGGSPPSSQTPKLSGGSSTRSPEIKEYDHSKHVVSYAAERLPTPVPASAYPSRSWPSLFLPDSGFADSSEISPFSLFSRIADIMNSNEDEGMQSRHDSQELWPRFDDMADFFVSPRKRFSQGYDSEELDPEEFGNSNGDYEETRSDESESKLPIYINQDFFLPLQI